MERLEVFATDRDMVRLTGPFEYDELMWDRAYHEAGSFSVTVPESAYSDEWAFIMAVGRPEVGRIMRVVNADTEQVRGGVDSVKVSGLFCESDLNRRVVFPPRVSGWGVEADPAQTVTDWAKALMGGRFDSYDAPGFEGVPAAIVAEDAPLGDVAYEALLADGGSIRARYDWEGGTWSFGVWRGLDRSQTQDENSWVVFSDAWGTLSGHEAAVDSSAYANVAVVKYEYDQPASFASDGSPAVYDEEVPYVTKAGYMVVSTAAEGEDEVEAFFDMTDVKPPYDRDWPRSKLSEDDVLPTGAQASYQAFPAALQGAAIAQMAAQHPMVRELTTSLMDDNGYMTDWDIGDRVTFAATRINLAMDARVTRVTEVHASGRSTIAIEVGDRKFRTRERQVR